ncbi:MAG: YkgJ family cysteine cluster protein [Steroidobacter sp.]
MRRSLKGDEGMDVPCGECVGCCVSGYSVQLRPEDQRARTQIPTELLVSPPGFPTGHMTVPPRPDGACPMLDAGRCTIYHVRPQTCLDYDCRIFSAAAIEAGKPIIDKRVREWRFSYPTEADRLEHAAVTAAATFIREYRDSFAVRVPATPMGIAVFAIKAYSVFLDPAANNRDARATAGAMLEAVRMFDRELAAWAADC